MKAPLMLAVLGAGLAGCASDEAKLKQDHSYVVEWIGDVRHNHTDHRRPLRHETAGHNVLREPRLLR